MAHFTGTAVDMLAVRAALISACTAEGWAWNSSTEVLSKGPLFLRVQVVSGYLTLLGRTSAAAGDMPSVCRMGAVAKTPLAYPLTYEVFVFDDEVYLVINYSIDFYQFAAFGRSVIESLTGTRMWVYASLPATSAANDTIAISPTSGSFASQVTPGLFWASSAQYHGWVHSNIDGQGWWTAQTAIGSQVGITPLTPLLGLLPNAWNSEGVLLPIRAFKVRPSNKISIIAELQNARHVRIDNYDPGQVIDIGPDRWKIFPCYRKNVLDRNGGSTLNHTGTFGWAVRYEGD